MNITLTRRTATRRHFDARRCWHEEIPAHRARAYVVAGLFLFWYGVFAWWA